MKKNFIIILAIFVVILLATCTVFLLNFDSLSQIKKEYDEDTSFFMQYEEEQFDVNVFITIMNKAIQNNEDYGIEKDDDGLYIEDEKYSIKIYLQLDDRETLIPMESLMQSESGGSSTINNLFSDIVYKYQSIKYHDETNRVKEIIVYGFTIQDEMNLGKEAE